MALAQRYGFVLAHDNPYVDLSLEGEAPALLRHPDWRACGIEFFSLSKGWCLGGYRLGFAIGAAWLIEALRQLKKNPAITVIVSDALERPRAVVDGVIAKVDMVENVSSLNINLLARRIRPDLILIDPGAARRAMGRVSGGLVFTEAMQGEMAATSETPCLIL